MTREGLRRGVLQLRNARHSQRDTSDLVLLGGILGAKGR